MKPIIICIEGSIGVGKSTLLAAIAAARHDIEIIPEPVDLWESSGLLDALYDNQVSTATFQLMVQGMMQTALLDALRRGNPIICMERSPFSNEIFARANLKKGSWDLKAFEIAHHKFLEMLPPFELYVYYLKAPIATLKTRITRRGRSAEQEIPKAYMKKLEKLHDLWLRGSPLITTAVAVDTDTFAPMSVAKQVIDDLAQRVPIASLDRLAEA